MKNRVPDNYGGLPPKYSTYKNSKVVIVPVPFDKTSTWGKGADKGPRAIINASKHMELYDIETASEVYEKGIHTNYGFFSSNKKLSSRPNKITDFYKIVKNITDV